MESLLYARCSGAGGVAMHQLHLLLPLGVSVEREETEIKQVQN